MSLVGKLKRKAKNYISSKYPGAKCVFCTYKNNNLAFHTKHKFTSLRFLLKLIRLEKRKKDLTKVPFPKGAYNPFLSHSCSCSRNVNSSQECLAIADSILLARKAPKDLAKELLQYDLISFDVFDTLIFRPFAQPTDLFYLLGAQTGVLDFANLRRVAEQHSRHITKKPNFEIDIYDIYKDLSTRCFLTEQDAEKEIELEKSVCYANEYMLEVFNILKSKNKTIVATSDMYLPSRVIKSILDKNGFTGFDNIFVSCEYGYNKASGKLFDVVKQNYKNATKIAHVGDNVIADIKGAEKAGIASFHYQQCNDFGMKYRPGSLITPISSVYKGVVNNFIYSGAHKNPAREDFGFIYAGPVVTGYLEWINTFCKTNDCDFILFLARDMDIFYKAYNKYYKEYDNAYGCASRFALQELIAADFPDEYIFHTFKARCDRGYTIEQTLKEVNLEVLMDKCKAYGLNLTDFIVPGKIEKIEAMFKDNLNLVKANFADNNEAAKLYFKKLIGDHKKICIVDLGWRGSVHAYLKYLMVNKWNICEDAMGVLIGSTTSETSVNWIADQTVSSWAYNHVKNRDYHRYADDWQKEYIGVLIMESIFTSEDASLLEYRLSQDRTRCELLKYEKNANYKIINEFHKGIMRFIFEFEKHRKPFKRYLKMTEVDAFEPMFQILDKYEYIVRIVGDMVETPFAIAGLNINQQKYIQIGELMLRQGVIKKWPVL